MPLCPIGQQPRSPANPLRAGDLYLTVQDAIALALDNNIDIEVSRYNQSLLDWQLERSRAGGALPGVPSGATQSNSVANGQGVLGSQPQRGSALTNGNNGGPGSGNATVAQIGPVAQTLDPADSGIDDFSAIKAFRSRAPCSLLSNNLMQGQRVYSASYQQGFLTGGSINLSL